MMDSRFRPRQSQGQAQLQQELQVLGSMQHRHLVALLGWCPEEHCLVYELAERGNLAECLPQLDWVARTRIATEVCRGLVYLHMRCVRHALPPSTPLHPSASLFSADDPTAHLSSPSELRRYEIRPWSRLLNKPHGSCTGGQRRWCIGMLNRRTCYWMCI